MRLHHQVSVQSRRSTIVFAQGVPSTRPYLPDLVRLNNLIRDMDGERVVHSAFLHSLQPGKHVLTSRLCRSGIRSQRRIPAIRYNTTNHRISSAGAAFIGELGSSRLHDPSCRQGRNPSNLG